MTDWTTGDTSDNRDIIAELAGHGRIDVTPARTSNYGADIETPAGTLELVNVKPDRVSNEGSDYTRHYQIGAYDVAYSVDGSPAETTHSILVTDQ